MVLQLRIYQINPNLKTEFDKRFREHAARIMKTHEFDIKAMWYSNFDGRTEFIYILAWPDEMTMQKQWKAFMANEEWDKIKKQSREVHGEMVLAKVRDQILEDTEWFNNSIY